MPYDWEKDKAIYLKTLDAIAQVCEPSELEEIRFRWDDGDLIAIASDGTNLTAFVASEYQERVDNIWLRDGVFDTALQMREANK